MTEETPRPQIYGQMMAIQREIGPIAKSEFNKHQGYNYRGIEAVVNAATPMFAQHNVLPTYTITGEPKYLVENAGGKERTRCVIHVRGTFYAEDGSCVTSDAMGEGMDKEGDKACNKAMSAAQKYIIIQVFSIATKAQLDSEREEEGSPSGEREVNTDSNPMLDAQLKAVGVTSSADKETVLRFLALRKSGPLDDIPPAVILRKLTEKSGPDLLQRAKDWLAK